MAFNANFTEARMAEDGGLLVKGNSQPNHGASQILVSLAHGGKLHAAPVGDPHAEPWTATFTAAKGPFAAGEDVFVSGMAVRQAPHDPLVWQGGFTIKSLDEK
jgi:hypothetical protein